MVVQAFARLKRLFSRVAAPPPILFDAARYMRLYPDVAEAGVDPLTHYITHGSREGRSPHTVFDAAWYIGQRDAPPPGDPLADYAHRGWKAGASPHPLFHVGHYRRQLGGEPAVSDLQHYLKEGWRRGLDPHPYFSVAHYLNHNPDVAKSGIEPLTHYLTIGAHEDRAAHPRFDARFYRAAYLLDAPEGTVPLIDFVVRGWVLSRRPLADAPQDWRAETFHRIASRTS